MACTGAVDRAVMDQGLKLAQLRRGALVTVVADVARWLDEFAPTRLAESWDNVGLLWGDPAVEVRRVMTCLTVTATTAREAVAAGAELIVSHHPILFKAAQRIRAVRP